jgi:hypothetical protein
MGRSCLLSGTALLLVTLATAGASASAAVATAGQPPGKPAPPGSHPSKPSGDVSVGIAYHGGLLVLSSDRAGRAQIVLRSADGVRHWLKLVKLQTPTTTLRLKTLFPLITKGRYRVVVRPLFHGGFLSGSWITVR